jgi:putative pyruvate formate lyase activating enzyme
MLYNFVYPAVEMYSLHAKRTLPTRLKVQRAVLSSQHRRHRSYLSPPFLLDDYIPRYHLISSTDAAKKRSEAYAHLRNCNLCPRLCGVNRFEKTGLCLIGADVKVNTIAPHFGEG